MSGLVAVDNKRVKQVGKHMNALDVLLNNNRCKKVALVTQESFFSARRYYTV